MQNEMMHKNMWLKLAVMTVLSFIAMYFLMYSMINSIADLYLSVNQVYMAGRWSRSSWPLWFDV
jgi:hypothetical protein